jgi:hypothetical protein
MTNTIKEHIISVAILFVIASAMFLPNWSGKKIESHDTIGYYAAYQEGNLYKEKGEDILWTNRVFSGMPLYTIGYNSGGVLGPIFKVYYDIVPESVAYLFMLFACTYVALLMLGASSTTALIFSIATGLNSWIIDSLVAGHVTKIQSLSFLMIVISGLIFTFKNKNWWWGIIAVSFGLSFAIAYNHIQIVYYGMLICLAIAIYYLIDSFRLGSIKDFLLKSAALVIAVIIAVLSNYTALKINYEYSKDTMRGGKTELTKNVNQSTSKAGGLDMDYAYSWSYGPFELTNLFIANATGGASNYNMKSKDSKLAQGVNYGEDQIALPTYWGAQPFTGAPNYIGIFCIFFFLYYLLNSKDRFRWLLFTLILLSLAMALGKNFKIFTEWLFLHLPFYNKFRTPTMALSIANIMIAIGGVFGFKELFFSEDKSVLLPNLKKTFYACAGLVLIALVIGLGSTFSSEADKEILKSQPDFPLQLLIEDRKSLFKSDIFRAIMMLLAIGGLMYAFIKDKLEKKWILVLLGVLVFADLWTVDKRYFDQIKYEEVKDFRDMIPYENYAKMIEQDKTHFRIFNTTANAFNDNMDGYRFSNVGGYSPAKLYRYQDLIDNHLNKGTPAVYDMLNTKYFIVQNGDQKMPQLNPNACGNAWFVQNIKWAKNADEEMDSLATFNPKTTAWIDARYKNMTTFKTSSDTSARIMLSKYHPDRMEYTTSASQDGFAVFSEIWYKGNEDWKAFIDGKEVPMVRVNYLLRGLSIPSGSHQIVFVFKPAMYYDSLIITRVAGLLIYLMLIFGAIYFFKNKKNTEAVL